MTGRLYPTVREEREMAIFEQRQDARATPLWALGMDSDGLGTLVSVRCYFCAGELRVDGYRVVRIGQEAVIACEPTCREDGT